MSASLSIVIVVTNLSQFGFRKYYYDLALVHLYPLIKPS
jgi:hypothetical protein